VHRALPPGTSIHRAAREQGVVNSLGNEVVRVRPALCVTVRGVGEAAESLGLHIFVQRTGEQVGDALMFMR
jgi:hypothetical protein